MSERRKNGLRALAALGLVTTVLVAPTTSPASAGGPPLGFDKAFAPATIGPGNVSTLTFTITNPNLVPITGLAFTDPLPAGMTIADPANASMSCTPEVSVDDSLTATAGTALISLADAGVGAGASCTIEVDVTASSPGPYMNTSSALTSDSGGSGGFAIADLVVDDLLPAFTKSFAPPSVPLGARSTLTLTINNTLNEGAGVPNLDFTDSLPPGMTIASPANESTTCGTPTIPPTLIATPGTSTITLDANGTAGFPAVGAGATCAVAVDVIADAAGSLLNSAELLADFDTAGKATAVLEVTASPLAIAKSFTDDPVAPGDPVTLDFTISNISRTDAATGVGFTDALPAGAVFSSLLGNDCGGTVSTTGSTTITLVGGAIAAEGSCTISTSLTIPAGTPAGTYLNTTNDVTGTVGGSAVTGNTANDTLFVVTFPLLTKEFIDDPVGAGGAATLRFTITNRSSSALTDIAFTDDLQTAMPGLAANSLVSGETDVPMLDVCGTGSQLTVFNPPDITFVTPPIITPPDPTLLEFTGGSLAAAGSPGDSCVFDIVVDVPAGTPSGTFTNTSSTVTANDGAAVEGPAASGDLVVVGAPILSKQFIDDPVAPGGTVTMEFTIRHSAAATADATGITFTDDLAAIVPVVVGLTASLPPTPDPPCGAGSTLTGSAGDTLLTFAGGTLAPGEECTFSVVLSVPSGATPGLKTNTTSPLTATVDGTPATSAVAEDDFLVSGFTITKEFTDDPVIAGGLATLAFTLDNTLGTVDATAISFGDDLDEALAGLAAISPPPTPCGGALSGTSDLSFASGIVAAGTSCSFTVSVLVPAGTLDGAYTNTTDNESASLATVPATTIALDPAIADLEVDSTLLEITKEFTDDPVAPGDSVTLEFTLTNLSATETVTDIEFSDDLDAALGGLAATAATGNTCVGGMALIPPPVALFEYVGATLTPGASCTITLTVLVPSGPFASSTFTNTTSELSGKVGALDVVGDPASDDLEVQTVTLTKSFDGPTGATSTADLSFTITNLDSVNAVGGLSFTDDLDAMMSGLVATTLPSTPCGAGSTITGTSFLALVGGNLAASDSCTFVVTVTVPGSASAGSYDNTTSELFSSGLPVADAATASLTIEPRPTFTKVFAPDTIVATTTSTLTFTIDNTASTIAADSLSFTDALPAGVVIATPSGKTQTCTGGMADAPDGGSTITYGGGSVAAGGSCTISVDVTSAAASTYVNTTGDLTSSSGNSGTATDTLTVTALVPPTFAKAFAPDTIIADTTSTLTFTIDNSLSTVAATALDFTDTLPVGVVLATPLTKTNTCTGGMSGDAAGDGTFSFSGGSVAAGTSCTVSVDVTSAAASTYVNTTGDLTSSSGNSGTATDTLTVTPRTPPTVTIEQAAGQADPTASAPINFTVVFNEAVTGFDSSGVVVVNGTVASVTPAGANTFTVAVTPTLDGIVTASVATNAATDGEGTGNLASTSTDNSVNYDSTDPVITTPGSPLTVDNDPGEAGAVVNYVVTTTDEGATTGTLSVRLLSAAEAAAIVLPGGLVCTPPSGSFFPIGTTAVTCTATDAAGNTSTSMFNIVVVDTEVPVLSIAGTDIDRMIAGGTGAVVTFPTPTATDNSGPVTVVCTPPSGSTFPVGTTVVTCTATDGSNNTASTSFNVTVALNNVTLPKTGGGLDGFTIALQVLLAGLALVGISRIRGRKRLAAN